MSYGILNKQLQSLIEDEHHFIPNMANASALLYGSLKDLNWAGFYLMDQGELMLGPFQGNTACIRIKLGKGVCGTAAKEDKVMRVEDVHQFEGHIACDCASNSEIVVPIHKNGEIFGVLDIDSPLVGRFTEEDEKGLVEFVSILEKYI
ncbi:MAG: GAF domain-containing protein [Lachnospiraceae bacterium]|nr:GAF domain-containing protein [Lachnospiraceae bacterium]